MILRQEDLHPVLEIAKILIYTPCTGVGCCNCNWQTRDNRVGGGSAPGRPATLSTLIIAASLAHPAQRSVPCRKSAPGDLEPSPPPPQNCNCIIPHPVGFFYFNSFTTLGYEVMKIPLYWHLSSAYKLGRSRHTVWWPSFWVHLFAVYQPACCFICEHTSEHRVIIIIITIVQTHPHSPSTPLHTGLGCTSPLLTQLLFFFFFFPLTPPQALASKQVKSS